MNTNVETGSFVTYPQYMQEATALVLHTMLHLDLGHANEDGKLASGRPGENDPTFRTSAFSLGVDVAAQPLVESYETVEKRDFQAIFDSTFRLSFHYSAGVPLIQSLYQLRIAQLLRDKYGEEALFKATNEAVFNPSTTRLPVTHKQSQGIGRVDHRAPVIWNFYMDILRNVEAPENVRPADKMRTQEIDLLKTFGCPTFIALSTPYFLLSREIVYLTDGRPNRSNNSQRYHSDVHDHALAGKPIGNPEFNYIFSEMGIVLHAIKNISQEDLPDFYIMTGLKARIEKLENFWKIRHKIST